jgi:hypothetical protein
VDIFPAVQPGSIYQAGAIAHLIATRLAEGPIGAYLVPDDPPHRHLVLAAVLRIHVGHADAFGDIDLIDNAHCGRPIGHSMCRSGPCAAALWLPRTGWLPEPLDYRRRLGDAAGPYLDRFHTLDRLLANHQPASIHHHLAFLASCQDDDDHSAENALLDYRHDLLDDHRLAAYTVADTPELRDRLAQVGYRLLDEIPLPDAAGTLWAMLRPARARTGDWA